MAASSLLDGVRFTPTLGGLTDWTYSTAVIGYNSPSLANAVNSAQYSYHAETADKSQWEDGIGPYNTSTGVLTRATVLYNSSGTGAAAGQSGAGTKINFSTVPTVAIVALKEDLNQPPTRASFNASSSLNPAGFTNTTGLMLGCGSTFKITPVYSGIIPVTIWGVLNASGGQLCGATLRYGTGTAPANAAALAGTALSAEIGTAGPGSSNVTDIFALTGVITGAAVGTALWLDISMRTSGATSQSISSIGCSAHEI